MSDPAASLLSSKLVDFAPSSQTPFLMQLNDFTSNTSSLLSAPLNAITTPVTTAGDNVATGSDSSATPSPVLSSSPSSTTSSSISSNSYPSADTSLISEDYFYQHLQTHSSLLRIMMKRSLPTQLLADQWHRLDLQVLDEFGMSIKGQRAKASNMRLDCQVLERYETEDGGARTVISKTWAVQKRALLYDAWEWTDETLHMTVCSGFDRSGAGGLEFKMVQQQGDVKPTTAMDHATTVKKKRNSSLYLRIVPTFDSHQTIHALPLVVGPLSVLVDSVPSSLWKPSVTTTATTPGNYPPNMYRTYTLGDTDLYFMIKEGWNLGTPGKMWDSALVISDLFVQRIIQHPACMENCHLLDLSAGTGTAGLLISFVYQYILSKQHHHRNINITLTDLPEALPLIHYNGQLNGIDTNNPHITVAPLSWGRTKDIQHIRKTLPPIDIIIASDVLYEPANFAILVETLIKLSEPGRTVIYLGYKRRGLKQSDEQYFFDLCRDNFDIHPLRNGAGNDITDGKNGADEINDMVPWEKRYGQLLIKRDRMDGLGWLGPYAHSSKSVPFQQTNVQVYRLVRKRCRPPRRSC